MSRLLDEELLQSRISSIRATVSRHTNKTQLPRTVDPSYSDSQETKDEVLSKRQV